ncbi:hypothetical protein TorRG33x02_145610, partial [Trema orientale]
ENNSVILGRLLLRRRIFGDEHYRVFDGKIICPDELSSSSIYFGTQGIVSVSGL